MTRWKLGLLGLTGVGVLSIGALSLTDSGAASKPAAPKPAASAKGNGNANAHGHRDFVVSGQVGNLAPGASRPMVLTVRNPNNVAIRVTSLTVTASAASPSCPASALALPSWTGSLLVPENDGTASVTVNIGLEATAPNACQSARWPFAYGGTAVKA